jgi:hypothetical protein
MQVRNGIAPLREYELRLIAGDGKPPNVLRFTRATDEAASQFVLTVKEPYERFELWRGMDKIADGPRFVIGN